MRGVAFFRCGNGILVIQGPAVPGFVSKTGLTLYQGTGCIVESMDNATIGDFARKTGVNIETVRYYERRGLLPRPARNPSNYRLYGTDAKRRVNFIKRAQGLGFSLREIQLLLSLRATPRAKCEDVRAYAETKTHEIEKKIRSLRAMQKALKSLIAECSGKAPVTQCPILGSLESDNSQHKSPQTKKGGLD